MVLSDSRFQQMRLQLDFAQECGGVSKGMAKFKFARQV
jgi:hypothetical protein